MGTAVLILGFSGSGKSASMRNFGADELALVNVNGKALPFRTRFTSTINSDKYPEIMAFIGRQKAKTIGKLLDEKITVEGMFTIVLKTVVVDGKYLFATQTDGTDTCKSPIGLFDKMYISNDLKLVDEAVRQYYSFSETAVCEECGGAIVSDGKRTVQQIIEGSKKAYGKQLCMKCVKKRVKAAKEVKKNETQTVSE